MSIFYDTHVYWLTFTKLKEGRGVTMSLELLLFSKHSKLQLIVSLQFIVKKFHNFTTSCKFSVHLVLGYKMLYGEVCLLTHINVTINARDRHTALLRGGALQQHFTGNCQ